MTKCKDSICVCVYVCQVGVLVRKWRGMWCMYKNACGDLFFCLQCCRALVACIFFYIIPPIVIKLVSGHHIGLVNYPISGIACALTAQSFCLNNLATMNIVSFRKQQKPCSHRESSGWLLCEWPRLCSVLPVGRKSHFSTASPSKMSVGLYASWPRCINKQININLRPFITLCHYLTSQLQILYIPFAARLRLKL